MRSNHSTTRDIPASPPIFNIKNIRYNENNMNKKHKQTILHKTNSIKQKLYTIIFESDTGLGLAFDIALIITIVFSVLMMMLESIGNLQIRYERMFFYMEWSVTILFLLEYIVRLYASPRPIIYIRSFFGIVDFICILPSFASLLLTNSHYFIVFRLLRVMRVFRLFRLGRFLAESERLLEALKMSARRVILFVLIELILTVIFGSIMYVIEGEANGFTSIPRSIYWAIVTMTTVGYGDISPKTALGQGLASLAMIVAYSIVVISTGMIGNQTIKNYKKLDKQITQRCQNCNVQIPDIEMPIKYCPQCGNTFVDVEQ